MHHTRQLRERIMRRVWGIYVLRRLTSPALRLAAMAGTALALVSSVSIKNIIENALSTSGLVGLARFSLSAVLDTSLFVQSLLVLALVLIAFFVVDTIRNLAFTHSMQRSGT